MPKFYFPRNVKVSTSTAIATIQQTSDSLTHAHSHARQTNLRKTHAQTYPNSNTSIHQLQAPTRTQKLTQTHTHKQCHTLGHQQIQTCTLINTHKQAKTHTITHRNRRKLTQKHTHTHTTTLSHTPSTHYLIKRGNH